LNLDDDQIAIAVNLSSNTVRCLHSRFRLHGEEAPLGVGRGGRRRQNLSVEQEDEVLRPFLEEASIGGILVVNPIKIAYEQAVGHAVPKSTIYRLLARHVWRKLTPGLAKADSEVQEEFKKTPGDHLRRNNSAGTKRPLGSTHVSGRGPVWLHQRSETMLVSKGNSANCGCAYHTPVYVCFCSHQPTRWSLILPMVTAQTMSIFLSEACP